MLGKGRRVENDEIVVVASLFQILESILAESIMASIAREIHLHVGACQLNRLGRAVNRVNHLCTTSHGIDREAACVAEHVQYVASLGIVLQQRAVLALIHEEARLLSAQPVHSELQSVLLSRTVVSIANNEPILWFHEG